MNVERRALTLRPPKEVGADSLQSPHDPEATYRVKGSKRYRGGYVANVSETAEPDNPVQLITDVQVEPNQADDALLLEQSLDNQAARGIAINKVTGHSASDRWGWEEYTWQVEEEGTPLNVTCPRGYQAVLQPSRAEGRFIARFDAECCAECPFLGQICRVQNRARVGPTLYVQQRAIQVARQRQQLCPEDTPIRAVVESTIRSLKRAFPGSKLPVHGLIRARMMLYSAALMVNLCRLHHWLP